MLYRAQNTRKAYELFHEVLANHTGNALEASSYRRRGNNRRRGGASKVQQQQRGKKEEVKSPWTDSAIETTKGKLIYSRGKEEDKNLNWSVEWLDALLLSLSPVNAEATPEGLASVSRSSVINGLPNSYYNRDYAARINAVTREDLERVAEK